MIGRTMFKPGTYEVIVLCGVPITIALEEVFKDFLMHCIGRETASVDDEWVQVWGVADYQLAIDAGLVLQCGLRTYSTKHKFTLLGKKVYGCWLLIKESGAHQQHSTIDYP